MSMNHEIADAINGDRLWRRHMDMAKIGATGRGGVDRQALTPEDAEGRALLIGCALERGYKVDADPMGNLFVHRPGSDQEASPVMAGSHLDTQPSGGNFDGIFGVLAGFETLEALDDANIYTRRPLEVAVWTNEEGSRFQPPMMGSAVFTGALPIDSAMGTVDRQGMPVEQALAETMKSVQGVGTRDLGFPVHAYLEAHIEQGPVLEGSGNTIGVVTGIQGLRWYTVDVTGQEGHAGTTLRRGRKDALFAAMEMIIVLKELTQDDTDTLRFTVGRFEVSPNSPNIVPSHVYFTVDIRHPVDEVVADIGNRIEAVCRSHAGLCEVSVSEILNVPTTVFDDSVVEVIRRSARDLNLPNMDIVSGPGHDAMSMAGHCPTGMIFVPCEGGISHSESEKVSPDDLAAGARVLGKTLVELAGR